MDGKADISNRRKKIITAINANNDRNKVKDFIRRSVLHLPLPEFRSYCRCNRDYNLRFALLVNSFVIL